MRKPSSAQLKQLSSNIKNRGTGAGGSNTNKHGLQYEALTDLHTEYTIQNIDKKPSPHYNIISFKQAPTNYLWTTKQSHVFKCLENHIDQKITSGHGCKKPDECFINQDKKQIFIIEKKFQQTAGSVCEKIQTADFKIWQYGRTFPSYKIIYIYCLSDWFRENCKAELEYLELKNVPVFWGSSPTYKKDMVNFILSQ